MPKVPKSSAVLSCKCPRCRQGNMFDYPVWDLSHFAKMNRECSNCGFRFEVEPGFFIGAMYVSYAMVVALLLTVGFLLYLFLDDPPVYAFIIGIVLTTILLLPLIFRYSRVLYLYWFGGVRYRR